MDGILPLWKPKGMTSHDCVFQIRKILKMKKVGHTGTLDPEVDGVLPICLGRATKVAQYITDAGKVYEGEVTIGVSTTTEDAHGDIVEEKNVDREIPISEIEHVLSLLTGEIEQTPPMFSAVKINGKKLYEYARQGITIERPSRTVHIYELQLLNREVLLSENKLTFKFRVHCSKGTYIRTLAVMIGEKLGYPAHMSSLTRIASASFKTEDCISLERLKQISNERPEDLKNIIKPLETGLAHLPFWQLDDELLLKVINGAVLKIPENWPEGHVVMVYNNLAYAIYQKHPEKENVIKPVKVLRNL